MTVATSPVERICRRLGMTQNALAAAADVSQSSLSLAHQGMRPLPAKLLLYLADSGFHTSDLRRAQADYLREVRDRLDDRARKEASHDPHL